MRPDWDTYFLNIAKEVASRASCPRASVGAVIVRNHRILSTGYNGAPAGQEQCDEVGCLVVDNHCQRAIHAETNAIAHAARYGIPVDGATLYYWDTQGRGANSIDELRSYCQKCGQIAEAAGIARVVGRLQ